MKLMSFTRVHRKHWTGKWLLFLCSTRGWKAASAWSTCRRRWAPGVWLLWSRRTPQPQETRWWGTRTSPLLLRLHPASPLLLSPICAEYDHLGSRLSMAVHWVQNLLALWDFGEWCKFVWLSLHALKYFSMINISFTPIMSLYSLFCAHIVKYLTKQRESEFKFMSFSFPFSLIHVFVLIFRSVFSITTLNDDYNLGQLYFISSQISI